MTVPSAITIKIAGNPVAQPRTRHAGVARSAKTGRHYARTYNPKDADGWKDRVYLAAVAHKPAELWTGPVRVDAIVYFARPKYLLTPSSPAGPVRHTAKPDRDNLDKAILDALVHARLFRDDAQVCDGRIEKFYHALGFGPGAVVRITYLEGVG